MTEIPPHLEKAWRAAHGANSAQVRRNVLIVLAMVVPASIGLMFLFIFVDLPAQPFVSLGMMAIAFAFVYQSITSMRLQELVRLATDPPEDS